MTISRCSFLSDWPPSRNRREPVEQFGVRGSWPILPKSLGVSTSPRPKWYCQTRLTIDRQVERVVRVGEPLGQGRAAVALGVVRRQVEAAVDAGDGGERAGADFLAGPGHVAARQDVDRPRLAAVWPGADERAAAGVDGADVGRACRDGSLRGRGSAACIVHASRTARSAMPVRRARPSRARVLLALSFVSSLAVEFRARRIDAVGQVRLPPADGRLDAVERRHRPCPRRGSCPRHRALRARPGRA